MTATADMILERRRERRRLTIWRIIAIVAIVVAVISFLPKFGGSPGAHIARITVEGVILSEPKRERVIRALAKNDDVEAVIVAINSPGGTVVASESIYEALREVAEAKPVVSVMGEYAASGGYITALAGEHIIAGGNTLTGSIGVVAEVPNVAGLMEMLGVEVTRIKSAPLKAEPSFTETPSPDALRAQEDLILDMFGWFRGLVETRRGLDGAALAAVTDGRAYTGRQALELSLVDLIGDEKDARAWLADEKGVSKDLAVLDHDWRDPEVPWPLSELQQATSAAAQIERLFSPVPRMYALIQ